MKPTGEEARQTLGSPAAFCRPLNLLPEAAARPTWTVLLYKASEHISIYLQGTAHKTFCSLIWMLGLKLQFNDIYLTGPAE